MFQGNWTCSKCGGVITELPFEPRSESGLTCRTCYAKGKAEGETPMESAAVTAPDLSQAPDMPDIPEDAGFAGEQPPAPDFEEMAPAPAEKPQFEGQWTCATCGGSITSLPFEPRSTENLKCLDCFKKSKA